MIYRLSIVFLLSVSWLTAGCGSSEVPRATCLEKGVLDCPCLEADMCNKTEEGTQLVCKDEVCKVPVCSSDAGLAEGCLCGDKPCSEGLICFNGECQEDTGQTLDPPKNPQCYTPCQGGSVTQPDGKVTSCGDEDLLEGCIGGAECKDGTCIMQEQTCGDGGCIVDEVSREAAACDEDVDCPDHQNCIDNRCYSDCERDSDCRQGRSCYQKACRVPCEAAKGDEQCPDGTFCKTDDARTGYCLPLVRTDAKLPKNAGILADDTSEKDLTIEPASGATFTPTTTEATITFTNTGDEPRKVTVRKLSHTEIKRGEQKLIEAFPLPWLKMGAGSDKPQQVQELTFTVPARGGKETLKLTEAENKVFARWTAVLEVTSEGRPTRRIQLDYAGSPEGRWAGRAYYMANFGTRSLQPWLEHRDDRSALQVVGNALIRRWGAFRDGRISWDEFAAVLTATATESWRWDSTKKRCPTEGNPNPNAACYLYDNNTGISIYSDNVADAPVPTGVVDVPIAMNLHAADVQTAPGAWTGRIVSSEALQYAGDPKVDLTFASDPRVCARGANGAAAGMCTTLIESLSSRVVVGGRYLTNATDTQCTRVPGGSFARYPTPWLVPGFQAYTDTDPAGTRYRYECRDSWLPFGRGASVAQRNRSLAGSNPIPDGAVRAREITLLDGALINQEQLFILFEERFPSFLSPGDADGFVTYGYMLLRHDEMDLPDEDYDGNSVADARAAPGIDSARCTPKLIKEMSAAIAWEPGENEEALDATSASKFLATVIQGSPPVSEDNQIKLGDAEVVHYFCEDTNSFDGGPQFERDECPVGSKVRYFTLMGSGATEAAVRSHNCHFVDCKEAEGACGCQVTLNDWIAAGTHSIRVDPAYRCDGTNQAYCSEDRRNLRTGKIFFEAGVHEALYQPLDELVQSAFRYKVKFRNRSGKSVGFAPDLCIPDSNQIPYCYAPDEIEEVQERIDCAVHIYTDYFEDLEPVSGEDVRSFAHDFLSRQFSYGEGLEGFEDLNAELLIMQGDEGFTAAFRSRFDLARQNLASFQGSLFEPNGIDLEGGAGFEMVRLYQATQYYQLALDRFYALSPRLWRSMSKGDDGLPAGQGFVTPATVVSYFDRLIRASSQKTRAFSEIAKRYQRFNRPALARFVIERAYTAAHLESMVLARMMLRVVDVPNSSYAAQVEFAVEQAQRTYRAALLEMFNVYKDISDDLTMFGFAPDYIPFPVLNTIDRNAFTVSMVRAQEQVSIGKEKEQRALEDSRSFDTSSAMFQSELASLSRNYETQLSEICGSIEVDVPGGETQVYPAIPQYAYLNERAKILGNPCGFMGTGTLYESVLGIEEEQIRLRAAETVIDNIETQIDDTQARTNEQCQRIEDLRDWRLALEDDNISLRDTISGARTTMSIMQRLIEQARHVTSLVKCSVGTSTDCPSAIVASASYGAIAGIALGTMTALDITIAVEEHKLQLNERSLLERTSNEECDAMRIDTRYTLQDLMRRAIESKIEALRVGVDIRAALSRTEKLSNQATALMDQMAEASEMAINIEASRNDPNVRIYRNDAVLAADQTFTTALRQAYRATRVFEYYTSQSYAKKEQLSLIRMVSAGDFTLERYLADLSEQFLVFEEQFGAPETRVAVISLRDDVLNIPALDDKGVAIKPGERTSLLRERIKDVSLLDGNGYITMPFSTSLDRVSPLTSNHKIQFIEAEIIGSDLGDTLGRIYVRQKGTGVIRSVAGDKQFYAFPERTAVVDMFFNGSKFFDPSVYRNERLRERPIVNTGWELVFNQKDEFVNQDVNLSGLNDIRLYVYYSDFTGI